MAQQGLPPPPPMPPVPPPPPMSPEGAAAGPRFAGTGQTDLGGWLNAGWNLIREDLLTFAVATFLMMLISVLTCGICGPAMQCGLFIMLYRRMTSGHVEINHVFEGFRCFVPALLAGLLLGVVAIAIAMVAQGPGFVLMLTDPKNHSALALARLWSYPVSTVLNALFGGAIFFVFSAIAARNYAGPTLGPVDAIVASWEVFRRNILMFTLTAFVLGLIGGLGALACCIGMFVTMPLFYGAQAQAYVDHFGLPDLGMM